ncbi:MAG: hypothetical protein CM15mP125_2920 [Gammaproteobacteria bacterium]|nr:MAG: hypothetical protein CM15mP125_2920 [Gammaproteobacteria bacterium]
MNVDTSTKPRFFGENSLGYDQLPSDWAYSRDRDADFRCDSIAPIPRPANYGIHSSAGIKHVSTISNLSSAVTFLISN